MQALVLVIDDISADRCAGNRPDRPWPLHATHARTPLCPLPCALPRAADLCARPTGPRSPTLPRSYLARHARHYYFECRLVGYKQFLESYSSVRLESMAATFGLSTDFLDKELSMFIASGRLRCKIDQVAGVIVTKRLNVKNTKYQATIKEGDLLLNRIQKLSRVINV